MVLKLPLTNIFAKSIETTRSMLKRPIFGMKPKHVLEGTVLRKSGDKTLNVMTPIPVYNAKYRVTYTRPVKRLVHDPYNLANPGDKIFFQQLRQKITDRKQWIITGFKKRDPAAAFLSGRSSPPSPSPSSSDVSSPN